MSTSTQDALTAGLSRIGRRGTPAYGEGTSAAFLAPPVPLAGVGAKGLDAITVSLQHEKRAPEASLKAWHTCQAPCCSALQILPATAVPCNCILGVLGGVSLSLLQAYIVGQVGRQRLYRLSQRHKQLQLLDNGCPSSAHPGLTVVGDVLLGAAVEAARL